MLLVVLLACRAPPAVPPSAGPGELAAPDHATPDLAASDPAAPVQLSFEVVPGNGFAIGGRVYDTSATPYEARAAFTEEVLAGVIPDVFAALGLDATAFTRALAPGGYQLQTSPSVQVHGALPSEAADDLAAALGWTTFQWSVLVTDHGAPGDTTYAKVHFPAPPGPALAQAFFVHAAAVNPALGGGYTGLGADLAFLNLKGDDGAPHSGLDDATFVAELARAVGSFSGAAVVMGETGRVNARLVGNEWTCHGDGEDYLAVLEDDDEERLPAVRAAYAALLEAAPLGVATPGPTTPAAPSACK